VLCGCWWHWCAIHCFPFITHANDRSVVDVMDQAIALAKRPHIICATPGNFEQSSFLVDHN